MPKDPELLQNMVSLAYQTARDRKLYPKSILIRYVNYLMMQYQKKKRKKVAKYTVNRSGSHNTTTINGRHQEDPNGWHLTFCYKDQEQLQNNQHTACHGYTPGRDIWTLEKSTHAGTKSDSMPKKNGKPVWPSENELEVAPEIGYGHISS